MPLSKIPVVLAEPDVTVTINKEIVFPEPVLEIKKVKKRLKLTQCRLMLPTNTVMISGFVRKNIQYATPVVGDDESVTSNIRSFTVDIDFSTSVQIDEFINMPTQLGFNSSNEFGYLRSTPLPSPGFSSKDTLMANDLSEFDAVNTETFNELPYCELTGTATFVEYDEALDRTQGVVTGPNGDQITAPFEEGTFTTIVEKMVVNFTVKVLQLQQIDVFEEDNGGGMTPSCPRYRKDRYAAAAARRCDKLRKPLYESRWGAGDCRAARAKSNCKKVWIDPACRDYRDC